MPVHGKEILKKISEKYSKDKSEFYLEYISENIKWNIVGQRITLGKENFLKEIKNFELENFPIIKIKNIIAAEEHVIVECTGKVKTKNGKSYNAYCDIYKIKNGKIQEMTTYCVNTGAKEK